ncbi:tyrosine-type recombinase/integrase [Streptomyces sp. cg35]|uniref:tyrosine-type recombinase/integrase n=1 Tax=Streptomyces sp. cg35 TaxID=3421650 RepID=UPI003D1780E4
MDPRTALAAWLAEDSLDRRGKEGRLLQGTSPERYGDIVKDWLVFIEDTVPIGAWSAQPSHVKTWLDVRGGAVRTRALRQSAVSAFYTYAMHFRYTDADPALVELRGRPQDEPETPKLGGVQMDLLRRGADAIDGPFAERDRLFTYLQLAGVRSRAVTEINLAHVVFEQHRMVIELWQKGGGTRAYAMPEQIRKVVKAYLEVRTWKPPGSHEDRGPLLVSNRGHRLDANTSPRTILQEVLRRARALDATDDPALPARVTPDMVALSPSPVGEMKELKESR